MNSDNLLTVYIGIPAYNEEANIKNLLYSIQEQVEIEFRIEKIVVISDGSTDRTVEFARFVAKNDPRIEVIEDAQRKGKSERLNEFFRRAGNSTLVLFDADVVLADKFIIKKLIQPLVENSEVGLVGGSTRAVAGRTFIENAVNLTVEAFTGMREEFKGGVNPYCCDGRILALSSGFFRNFFVPPDMIANDNYMYFASLASGYKFSHAREAVVLFRSPATITDHFKQNKRFIAARYRLERIFGKVVPKEYQIPFLLKFKWTAKAAFKKPLHALTVGTINVFCRVKAKTDERRLNAKWFMAGSTKVDIKR